MYSPKLTFKERCVVHTIQQASRDGSLPYKWHDAINELIELWYERDSEPLLSPYQADKEVWIYTRHQAYDTRARGSRNVGEYRYKIGRDTKLSPTLTIDTPNIDLGFSLAANMFAMEQALTAVTNLNITLGEVIYLVTTDIEAARVVAGDAKIEMYSWQDNEQEMCQKILDAIYELSKALPVSIFPIGQSSELWPND